MKRLKKKKGEKGGPYLDNRQRKEEAARPDRGATTLRRRPAASTCGLAWRSDCERRREVESRKGKFPDVEQRIRPQQKSELGAPPMTISWGWCTPVGHWYWFTGNRTSIRSAADPVIGGSTAWGGTARQGLLAMCDLKRVGPGRSLAGNLAGLANTNPRRPFPVERRDHCDGGRPN